MKFWSTTGDVLQPLSCTLLAPLDCNEHIGLKTRVIFRSLWPLENLWQKVTKNVTPLKMWLTNLTSKSSWQKVAKREKIFSGLNQKNDQGRKFWREIWEQNCWKFPIIVQIMVWAKVCLKFKNNTNTNTNTVRKVMLKVGEGCRWLVQSWFGQKSASASITNAMMANLNFQQNQV